MNEKLNSIINAVGLLSLIILPIAVGFLVFCAVEMEINSIKVVQKVSDSISVECEVNKKDFAANKTCIGEGV